MDNANTQDPNKDNDPFRFDEVDKTIVEGDDSTDSSALESANPYKIKDLPDGKEPFNLGSGAVKGTLGQGGMAKVYKIWNDDFEMFRAVKVILPGDNAQNYERFKTEIKITAKLQHPNIIQIYNIGEWQGLPFIEMEFIEGTTLTTYLAEHGKLSNELVVSFAKQIASALHYAHNCEYMIYGTKYTGIIHRDLKPDNIMVSNAGNLKLMDFGIARPTETGLHTMTGHFIGSPQYMSPEQFDGGSVDNRSDIYSLGTIVYEMLCGEKAFPGDNLQHILKMKAVNSYKNLKKFDFKVNPLLVQFSEKCMQEKMEKRFQNAQETLNDLERAEKSLGTSSLSPLEITRKTVKILQKQIEEPITTSLQKVKKQIGTLAQDRKINDLNKKIPWKPILISLIIVALIIAGAIPLMQMLQERKRSREIQSTIANLTEEKEATEPTQPLLSRETVFVKGGTYKMGGKNRKEGDLPIQKVTVEDFNIGKFEVTNREYLEFLNAMDITPEGSKNDTEYIDIDDADCAIGHDTNRFYFKGSSFAPDIDCPVIEVTWFGANAYCLWLKGRLPTEAEWEFACRAGVTTTYFWGNTMDSSYAWYGSNSGRKTHPVGKKEPNALGLHDMIGNVWEWCGSIDDVNYNNSSTDSVSTDSTSQRQYVLRGGSCFDLAKDCRIGKRLAYDPKLSEFLNGFRVVMPVTE